MKDGYRQILTAKAAHRRQVFGEATEDWPTSAHFIEKDFVVCAALNVLLGDDAEEAGKLVFKGGTSLSKAHNLIRRFSEDIDLVIVRSELGFTGDRDPFADGSELAGKARKRLIDELQHEAGKHIQTKVKPMLEAAFAPFGAKIETDEASLGQTLLLTYPSAFDQGDAYVDPIVKVEAGARSATLPSHLATIRPYVASVVDDVDLAADNVQTVDAQRTFLDKLLILHGRHCKYRDKGEIHRNANRESRHYYDLAMMADEVGPAALANHDLMQDVIRHSSLAFASGWMRMDQAAIGELLIEPPEGMREAIRTDYGAMAGMIMGDAPDFDWVLDRIRTIAESYRVGRAKA